MRGWCAPLHPTRVLEWILNSAWCSYDLAKPVAETRSEWIWFLSRKKALLRANSKSVLSGTNCSRFASGLSSWHVCISGQVNNDLRHTTALFPLMLSWQTLNIFYQKLLVWNGLNIFKRLMICHLCPFKAVACSGGKGSDCKSETCTGWFVWLSMCTFASGLPAAFSIRFKDRKLVHAHVVLGEVLVSEGTAGSCKQSRAAAAAAAALYLVLPFIQQRIRLPVILTCFGPVRRAQASSMGWLQQSHPKTTLRKQRSHTAAVKWTSATLWHGLKGSEGQGPQVVNTNLSNESTWHTWLQNGQICIYIYIVLYIYIYIYI